jgi:hypothetical protein
MRSLLSPKENIQHFKTWNFKLWVIFAFLDPDPDYKSGSGYSDPIESGSGSGSETSALISVSRTICSLIYKNS